MMNQPELQDSESAPNIEGASLAPVLVSVVIPAYQCSTSIAQALESVFDQTFTDFEVIVVNDGSPDTEQLERALQPYLDRIRYQKQTHQGPSAARNAGIVAAAGKYIALLDGDDYWFPDHLAQQVDLLQADSSLSLVYSNCLLLRNEEPVGTAFGIEPQMDSVSLETLITGDCSIATSSVVASREALLEAGLFNVRFMRCEDYDLWTRLALKRRRIAFSRNVQLCHRVLNGLSTDLRAMRQARFDVYERLASDLQLSPAQQQLVVRQIARTNALGQFAEAKRLLVSGDYRKSRAAAQAANSELQSRTLRAFIFGLRTAPSLVRVLYRAYGIVVSTRRAMQVAIWRRKYPVKPRRMH
jgi:glycosyltransferase involved in cell wall biosynthesis